jgi:hypothetical protein
MINKQVKNKKEFIIAYSSTTKSDPTKKVIFFSIITK